MTAPGESRTDAPAREPRRRLGFFTRVLDEGSAADRYQLALQQILTAEALGFDVAWVAQHHFHEAEGGLPSPLVLLAYAAALTTRIRLGTAIITLPLEAPLRVAEDAAVLSLLSGDRFELGIGSGGTPTSFPPFGFDAADRAAIYGRHIGQLVAALRGDTLTTDGGALYPAAPDLLRTLWGATFSPHGATLLAADGFGLMLSRTQPRGAGQRTLTDVQRPIIDAYVAALPDGVAPRILASRTLLVADDEATASHFAKRGVERGIEILRAMGAEIPAGTPDADVLALLDIHVGTPEQVLEELAADEILRDATDIAFQVHPIDPPPDHVVRSLELIATRVAPALGWSPLSADVERATSLTGGTR